MLFSEVQRNEKFSTIFKKNDDFYILLKEKPANKSYL
jgi:hypothetical protein